MSCDDSAFRLGEVGGGGPALLCLHGLTGTPYEVRPPEVLHTEHGFACMGPRLPGHCESPEALYRISRRDWIDCVVGAYDELHKTHEQVFVLGLSLGGVLALALAQRRSVDGLLLMGAPIDLGPVYRRLIPPLSRLVRSVHRTPGIVDREARERHPGYRRMPLGAVVELMRLQAEVEAKLSEVACPSRLLYSRADRTVRVGDAIRIASAVAGDSRIEYLERSGHVMPVDLERDSVQAWILRNLLELAEREER